MDLCRANRLVVLLLCLLIFASAPKVFADSQPRYRSVNTHGTIKYPLKVWGSPGVDYQLKVFRVLTTDDLTSQQRDNASFLASRLGIYSTKYWQGEIVDQIHRINPEVKVLLYRNMKSIKSSRPEWQDALDGGWLLKDAGGNLIRSTLWPTHYLVDIANQEYRDFVVEWLDTHFGLYGFDGVFADNCLIVSIDQLCYDLTGEPINPRTGKLYTNGEIRDDTISFINYVKSRIGNKLWISNGIFDGERFFNRYYDFVKVLTEASLDGFMSEGLFNKGGWDMGSPQFYSEDKWKKSVDFVSWIQNNFLNQTGRLFLANGRCLEDQIPASHTPERVATFIFSSLLLGITKPQNYLRLMAPLLREIQNLFEINLGVPIGVYYLIEGTRVYARNFTKVKVLVNPTDEPYFVNLNGDYETLEGQIVSSMNMGPHAGLILKVR